MSDFILYDIKQICWFWTQYFDNIAVATSGFHELKSAFSIRLYQDSQLSPTLGGCYLRNNGHKLEPPT